MSDETTMIADPMIELFEETVLKDLDRRYARAGVRRLPSAEGGLRINRAEIPSRRPEVSTQDVVEAMFREEWWPGQVVRAASKKMQDVRLVGVEAFRESPGFNVYEWADEHWDDLDDSQRRHLERGDWADAVSEEQIAWYMERSKSYEESREILDAAGLGQSLWAGLLVGVADPLNLAAGVGMARLAGTQVVKATGIFAKMQRAYISGRLARAGFEVTGGLAATVIGESVLVGTNDFYTEDQAAAVVVYSTFLDAGIQSIFAGIGRAAGGPEAASNAQRARMSQDAADVLRTRFDDAIDEWDRSGADSPDAEAQVQATRAAHAKAIDDIRNTGGAVNDEIDRMAPTERIAAEERAEIDRGVEETIEQLDAEQELREQRITDRAERERLDAEKQAKARAKVGPEPSPKSSPEFQQDLEDRLKETLEKFGVEHRTTSTLGDKTKVSGAREIIITLAGREPPERIRFGDPSSIEYDVRVDVILGNGKGVAIYRQAETGKLFADDEFGDLGIERASELLAEIEPIVKDIQDVDLPPTGPAAPFEPEVGLGAAATAEFRGVKDPELSKIAEPEDLNPKGSPKGRALTSNVARATGRKVGDVSPGGRLTPVSETRESPNHYVRLVANAIIDIFVPTKGHARNHPRIYRGERMESVVKATGFWRVHSIDLWNQLHANITRALGQNARARAVGERIGILGLMNDSRKIVDDLFVEYDRGIVRAKRKLASIEEGTLEGIDPKEVDDLKTFIAAMEERFETSLNELAPEIRDSVRTEFDAYMKERDALAKRSIGRTAAAKAIDEMHRAMKDMAVVRYGDSIANAADLDRAVAAVEGARVSPDKKPKDAAYWAKRGLDPDNPDHLAVIRQKMNAELPHVFVVADTKGILDLVREPNIRFSNLDTIELLSGLRKVAISDYFLDVVNEQFGLTGKDQLDSWEAVADYAKANSRKGGVDLDDPKQRARNDRSIEKMLQMVRIMTDESTIPVAGIVAESLYGSLRNMATAAYLVKTPISLVNELSQTTVLRIAREGTFGRGVSALINDVATTIKSASGPERRKWREWLAAFHSMDEARPGRGFEMAGYDPATLSPRASADAFESATGNFSSQVLSTILGVSREIADLGTSGKLLGHSVPVLRQMSMDGITRGLRRLAIIGHYRWFYDRLDDWVKVSDAVGLKIYDNVADAIAAVDLKHSIDPGDFATINSFMDADQLRRLAARRAAGEGIEMIEGVPVFNLNDADEGALRNFLDHVAQFEATTTPTVGTIPLSVQRAPIMKIFWQFLSFSTAFGNQNVMLTRLRTGSIQGLMMGAIMGAAMFDLFTRDALFHNFDTAVDRWRDETKSPERIARYMSEVIARTGYLNIADRAVTGIMDMTFGDAFERRLAPEHAVIPPALGYGEDLIRALGALPRAIGPGELSRSERELMRRVTVLSNMLPVRVLLPNEQPPRRFKKEGGE